ncbi:hypothetical protein [Candidatus Uabimicrobium sp. HlEnr_7]|uniref:hypothetical protein n=1 Tax=Candidatus Uabimicrobium helgolandensis TaxID=3095367 RepID=UPI0035579334
MNNTKISIAWRSETPIKIGNHQEETRCGYIVYFHVGKLIKAATKKHGESLLIATIVKDANSSSRRIEHKSIFDKNLHEFVNEIKRDITTNTGNIETNKGSIAEINKNLQKIMKVNNSIANIKDEIDEVKPKINKAFEAVEQFNNTSQAMKELVKKTGDNIKTMTSSVTEAKKIADDTKKTAGELKTKVTQFKEQVDKIQDTIATEVENSAKPEGKIGKIINDTLNRKADNLLLYVQNKIYQSRYPLDGNSQNGVPVEFFEKTNENGQKQVYIRHAVSEKKIAGILITKEEGKTLDNDQVSKSFYIQFAGACFAKVKGKIDVGDPIAFNETSRQLVNGLFFPNSRIIGFALQTINNESTKPIQIFLK